MDRARARELLREIFPCCINEIPFRSYEELRKKDTILADDLLDHIQWYEPHQYKITEYKRECFN